MSEKAGSGSPPPTRRTDSLTDSFLGSLTPKKSSKAAKAGVPYSCGKYFVPGMKHFAVHLVALMVLNGSIAAGINYFKGRPVIPLKGALMEGAIQGGLHFLVMEGRSWKNTYSIRYADSMLTLDKLESVIIASVLTLPLTYYGVKTLLHQKINILPTLVFSGMGAVTLSILELVFADYWNPNFRPRKLF